MNIRSYEELGFGLDGTPLGGDSAQARFLRRAPLKTSELVELNLLGKTPQTHTREGLPHGHMAYPGRQDGALARMDTMAGQLAVQNQPEA